MDETRWLVFAAVESKIGQRWWLWVVVTSDTCAYLLDPSRSAAVPRTHLGEDPEGIINADRYGVYKSLGGNIRIAFCWAHVRRDFLRVGSEYGKLKAWADAWVERIGELYYRFRVNSRFELTPDLQLIRRPGGNGSAPNVTVVGLRAKVGF